MAATENKPARGQCMPEYNLGNDHDDLQEILERLRNITAMDEQPGSVTQGPEHPSALTDAESARPRHHAQEDTAKDTPVPGPDTWGEVVLEFPDLQDVAMANFAAVSLGLFGGSEAFGAEYLNDQDPTDGLIFRLLQEERRQNTSGLGHEFPQPSNIPQNPLAFATILPDVDANNLTDELLTEFHSTPQRDAGSHSLMGESPAQDHYFQEPPHHQEPEGLPSTSPQQHTPTTIRRSRRHRGATAAASSGSSPGFAGTAVHQEPVAYSRQQLPLPPITQQAIPQPGQQAGRETTYIYGDSTMGWIRVNELPVAASGARFRAVSGMFTGRAAGPLLPSWMLHLHRHVRLLPAGARIVITVATLPSDTDERDYKQHINLPGTPR